MKRGKKYAQCLLKFQCYNYAFLISLATCEKWTPPQKYDKIC